MYHPVFVRRGVPQHLRLPRYSRPFRYSRSSRRRVRRRPTFVLIKLRVRMYHPIIYTRSVPQHVRFAQYCCPLSYSCSCRRDVWRRSSAGEEWRFAAYEVRKSYGCYAWGTSWAFCGAYGECQFTISLCINHSGIGRHVSLGDGLSNPRHNIENGAITLSQSLREGRLHG